MLFNLSGFSLQSISRCHYPIAVVVLQHQFQGITYFKNTFGVRFLCTQRSATIKILSLLFGAKYFSGNSRKRGCQTATSGSIFPKGHRCWDLRLYGNFTAIIKRVHFITRVNECVLHVFDWMCCICVIKLKWEKNSCFLHFLFRISSAL